MPLNLSFCDVKLICVHRQQMCEPCMSLVCNDLAPNVHNCNGSLSMPRDEMLHFRPQASGLDGNAQEWTLYRASMHAADLIACKCSPPVQQTSDIYDKGRCDTY
jgi:hypothetical protein